MPQFGAHMSIAKGCHNALLAGQKFGCDAVQLFSKNSNQWDAKPLTKDETALFRRTATETGVRSLIAHDSYLINLASPDKALSRRSVEAFIDEMRRAEALGLDYLVFHPGAATDDDEAAGLKRVARALDEVHRRCSRVRVQALIETTAGQGRCLGHRFEHLARILELVKQPERLGICLDTCHVFAAGYPLAPAADYERTFADLDRVVGLRWLKAFHVNDSAKPLGSRVDRHAHIGDGHLGLEPFRFLVNDPRFRDHPMILETPKEGPNDEVMDAANLARLRELLGTVKGGRSLRSPPLLRKVGSEDSAHPTISLLKCHALAADISSGHRCLPCLPAWPGLTGKPHGSDHAGRPTPRNGPGVRTDRAALPRPARSTLRLRRGSGSPIETPYRWTHRRCISPRPSTRKRSTALTPPEPLPFAKSEIGSSKSKTNPNTEIRMTQTRTALFWIWAVGIPICFGFRASDFRFGSDAAQASDLGKPIPSCTRRSSEDLR